MANFIWGANGEEVTPDEIAQRHKMAQALLQQGQQTPAYNWAQGAANMLNSFMGGFMQGRAMKAERANDDYNQALVAGLNGDGAFGGSGTDVSNPHVNTSLGTDAAMRLQGGGDQSDPFGGTGTDVNHPAVAQALIPSMANAPQTPPNPVAAALANPQTGSASPIAQAGGVDLITQHFLDRMRQSESGGGDGATNPNSSATGAFQFTSPTWTALRQQHPELGLTADGRTDPQQSEVAAKQLASDNIAYLMQKGVQSPTEGQTYLAHFAGAPTAANLIQASPDTPVSQVMSPQQIAANPFLRNMTAGQVQDWAAQKMGGAGPSQMPPQNPQYSAPNPVQIPAQQAPQIQSGPSMDALVGVLSDPRANAQTKGVASALLNNQLQLQQVQQRYQMEQADPENVARRRYYDMETQALQQRMNAPPKVGPDWVDLTPQEVTQSGRPAGQGWQRNLTTGEIRATAKIPLANVSVNTGNGGVADAASKAYATKSGENLAAQEQDGEKSGSLMGLGKTLEYLAPQIGGGGLTAEMANRLGAYMPDGWKPQGQGQREQFQSLVSDAIRQSHVPGEGPQSDADAARLSATMPQIMNSTQGNIAIARTIQALAQRKMDIGKLAGQQGRGEITPAQRAEAVRRLPDPYAAVRSYWQDTQNQNQPAQQPGTRTTSTGVTWSVR